MSFLILCINQRHVQDARSGSDLCVCVCFFFASRPWPYLPVRGSKYQSET